MKKDKKSLLIFIDFFIKGFVKITNFMKTKQIRYQSILPTKPKLIEILLDIKNYYIFCNPYEIHIEICFYFSTKTSTPSGGKVYKET